MSLKKRIQCLIILLVMLKVINCLESVQSKLLRNLSNKKEITPYRTKQLKATSTSTSLDNGKIETLDYHTLQEFPEVIYPTSIYESSQPFYYKTGRQDDILGPFSEDVQTTYKNLASNKKKPVPKDSASTSEVKKINTVFIPTKPEIKNISEIVAKENSDISHYSTLIDVFNETETKMGTLPKEPIFLDIIYKEGTSLESPTLELIPPNVPVRVKVNIEIYKDDMTENVNLTEYKDFEMFNDVTKSSIKEESLNLSNLEQPVSKLSDENEIIVLEEINDTDFISALSILLYDSLNNKPIEFNIDDIISTTSHLNDSCELSPNNMNVTHTYNDFDEILNFTKIENKRAEETNKLQINNDLKKWPTLENLEANENNEDVVSNLHKKDMYHLSKDENWSNDTETNKSMANKEIKPQ